MQEAKNAKHLSRVICYVAALAIDSTCWSNIDVYDELNDVHYGPYSSNATINLPAIATDFTITGATNDNIGELNVPSFTGTMNVTIGASGGNLNDVGPISDGSTGSGLFRVSIEVRGNIQNVNADAIGNVTSTLGRINGSLTSATSIGNISAQDGIFGNLKAHSGNILAIETAGNIGTSGTPIDIEATTSIGNITAEYVYADIDPKTGTPTTADGQIGSVLIHRSLVGSIKCGHSTNKVISIGVDPGFNPSFGGDLPSVSAITLGEDLGCPGGSCGMTESGGQWQIRIGNNFGGTINLPANGLTGGQISVNYNRGTAVWQSTGVVNVGSTILDKEQYTALPEDVGSGAGSAGRIGYLIQDNACIPVHLQRFTTSNPAPDEYQLRYYGPVKWTSSEPFKLQLRTATGGSWTDTGYNIDPTACKAIDDCTPATDFPSNGSRNLLVKIDEGYLYRNGFRYRIVPLRTCGDGVYCDQGSAVSCSTGNLVGDDSLIWFFGNNNCPADFNGDGLYNGADLSVLLANFGDTVHAGGVAGDANGDNRCNGADLSVLLALFGMSCNSPATEYEDDNEPGGEESFMAGENGPSGLEIVACFGRSSIQDYIGWVDGMTPTEFAEHAVLLQAIVEALESNEQ